MKQSNPVRHVLAIAIAASFFVVGCDRATTEQAQADAQRAGDKVQRGLDRAGEGIKAAAKKTEDKLAEAGQKVGPELERAADKISAAADRTGDKVASATTHISAGEKTSVHVSGVSDETKAKLSDSAITASVKAGILADPDLQVLKIDVDTSGGVVVLNGVVKDATARERATHVAGAVKGVREVRNHLSVKQG